MPQLVELQHIQGDLHMHTTESDGRATLQEMTQAAHERGLKYVAITIIRRRWRWPTGWMKSAPWRFAQQVREMNRESEGIRVFSGLECDILRDGKMDLADDALAELDWVVASVHSYFNL